MPTLSVLHLTDLHFTDTDSHEWNRSVDGLPKRDQPTLPGTIIKDIKDQGAQPAIVVVSGDLLDKGSEAGVGPAVDFLGELMKALSLPIDRLFTVPGNHDVLRSPDGSPFVGDRYERYDRIYQRLFGRKPFANGTQPHNRVETRHYDDLGLEVVGFNSCEEADDKDYDGYVGDSQRDYASNLIRAGDHFRIAVMHHHLVAPMGQVQRDLSVMRDGAMVRAWLVEKRFQLVLHGHQHVDWRNVYREDGDWNQSVVGGASLGVGEYGRKEWNLPLGYQIVEISGHVGRRRRRQYFIQTRRWQEGAGGDVSSQLWFGVQPTGGLLVAPPATAELPKQAAVSGTAQAISAKSIQETQSRKDEIRRYFETVASAMPQPDPGQELPNYLAPLLRENTVDHEHLRVAFGFPKSNAESNALGVLLESTAIGIGIHKSIISQRINHILWRWDFTLGLIEDTWIESARSRISHVLAMCKKYVLARAPTLNDVYRIIKNEQSPQPFAESAPDPTLYAVLRGISRPGGLAGERLDDAKKAALDYLFSTLEREKGARGLVQDSANLWWALRTGCNNDDERFAKLVGPVAQQYWEIIVPDTSITEKADVPEIYIPLRTQSYTLSNAQDIVETSNHLSGDDLQLLHGVIAFMRDQLVATPLTPQLYLASVHYEALNNFLDYANQLEARQK